MPVFTYYTHNTLKKLICVERIHISCVFRMYLVYVNIKCLCVYAMYFMVCSS
jgi:hypothetical protein